VCEPFFLFLLSDCEPIGGSLTGTNFDPNIEPIGKSIS